jgi:hypothetical protein
MAYTNYLDSTFVTQTQNQTVPNAFYLGSLSSGVLEVTTTTGALSVNAPLTSLGNITVATGSLPVGLTSSTYQELAIGAANTVLTVNSGGTAIAWSALPGSTAHKGTALLTGTFPTTSSETTFTISDTNVTSSSIIIISFDTTVGASPPVQANVLPYTIGTKSAGVSFQVTFSGIIASAFTISYIIVG